MSQLSFIKWEGKQLAQRISLKLCIAHEGYGSWFSLLSQRKPTFPIGVSKVLLGTLILLAVSSVPFAVMAQPYTFTTIAGLGGQSGYVDGTNTGARFYAPYAITKNGTGNFFVADFGNNRIRKLARFGNAWVVTTIAGPTGFDGPAGIAADSAGNLFVPNIYTHEILKISQEETNWAVTAIAGQNSLPGYTDGTNNTARFYDPAGIAVDEQGSVFVGQRGKIRKITPVGTNWVVTSIAGSSVWGSSDGTNTSAGFSSISGIALADATHLYVADTYNNTIRKVTKVGTNWVVTTVAGSAGATGSADGTNGNARFSSPAGIVVDASGALFVSDANNHTIRKLIPSGTNWIVTTIAGLSRNSGTNDGTGASARFSYPTGLILDGEGTIYLAGNYDHAIRFGQLIPSLGYSLAGNQLMLSWPTAARNYVLESSDALGPQAVWSSLTNDIAVSGESFVRSANLAAPAAFYRLRKP